MFWAAGSILNQSPALAVLGLIIFFQLTLLPSANLSTEMGGKFKSRPCPLGWQQSNRQDTSANKGDFWWEQKLIGCLWRGFGWWKSVFNFIWDIPPPPMSSKARLSSPPRSKCLWAPCLEEYYELLALLYLFNIFLQILTSLAIRGGCLIPAQ